MALKHWLPLAILAFVPVAMAQTVETPDITRDPTLFVVPYAHLDTQWRWNFPQTISEFLLKTMRVNFELIDKYPHYVFNWTGANRYRLMKEYYPADYARMKQYIAAGRWYPAGSSVEEGDVNLPNAESIFRQILYGNAYFRREFGKASAEYMLPDCFGFPASLPSILAAAGIKGFSTQKLNSNWQPAPQVGGPDSPEDTPEGIPFNVGRWEGPDGSTIVAALNPGSYSAGVRTDLTLSPPPPPVETPGRGGRGARPEEDWVKRIALDGRVSGVFADYHYIGTGDTGGAVNEDSVKLLEAMTLETEHATGSELHIIPSTADQMFLAINDRMKSHLPEYKGDLELINHSAGSLTSEAYHKRWNRRNEVLADMAEKASVAAAWMGALPYPKQRLNNAWMLVLGGQFHDTGAGTATPQAYEFAQNDDVIAMNQFAGVITSATRAIAAQLNTGGSGVPLVVYNSLNTPRQDVVEAAVDFPGGMPKAVRVTGPDGRPVPAQLENGEVVFVARVPSVGYAVYFAEPANAASSSELKVTENSLENARYRVKLDENGDVSSIFDKRVNKELLAAPMRLAISTDAPHQWPAWNMDFDQEQAAPRAYVGGAAKVRIAENGPARVALEVSRETEGSKFVETVSLAAGEAGDHVEFHEAIDWRTLSGNLKAVFPLTATNRMATYNWDVGTIERPTAYDRQFEVASHQWVDLTDESGAYGATILTGEKNGSDKRDDHTIRLTLIRTPGAREDEPAGPRGRSYTDQFNQDWGHHEITFGLAGHTGDWRAARTDWEGYRLNAPLAVFETARHAGTLGRSFSLVTVSNPAIRMLALKQSESGDEVIVRLVETHGAPAPNVRVKFAGPVSEAREVNAQEQPLGAAKVSDGALEASFTAYQPRTFALRLDAPRARATSGGSGAIRSQAVDLRYDRAVSSNDDTRTVGGFDAKGDAIPAEMLPDGIDFHGVKFHLAPSGTGKLDAMTAHGQVLALPSGFRQVYVLAASDDGDQNATFRVGSKPVQFDIENWTGFVGQWDTRLWKAPPQMVPGRGGREMKVRTDWAVSANHATWTAGQDSPSWSPRYPEDYLGLKPGFIKPAELAWYASHHHTADGLNQPYEYSYLFAYSADLPAGATSLTLPDNGKIRILAVSVAATGPALKPVAPLYDSLEPRP